MGVPSHLVLLVFYASACYNPRNNLFPPGLPHPRPPPPSHPRPKQIPPPASRVRSGFYFLGGGVSQIFLFVSDFSRSNIDPESVTKHSSSGASSRPSPP